MFYSILTYLTVILNVCVSMPLAHTHPRQGNNLLLFAREFDISVPYILYKQLILY